MINISFAIKAVHETIQMLERQNISELDLRRQFIILISVCSNLIGIVEGLTCTLREAEGVNE